MLRLIALFATVTACSSEADGNGDAGNGAGAGAGGIGDGGPPMTEGDWYRPGIETTWQWQLTGSVNTGYDVDVYDIDLFDSSPELIRDLQSDGRKVICYFSAGSSEDWRNDFERLLAEEIGLPLDEWEGENWLDIRSQNVHEVMLDRLDLAVDRGCDGVEPDNVDGFTNDTGFPLSGSDQLAYNMFLADAAHDRGLAVGLKNDGGQAQALVDHFDFELNEECHEYEECAELSPFTDAGKPIFNTEYRDTANGAKDARDQICPASLAADMRTLIMPRDLDDSFRVSCDE